MGPWSSALIGVHNNLIGDARAYGAIYVDEDVVVDGDLVTARTGAHCHLLARTLIDSMKGAIDAHATAAWPADKIPIHA